MAATTWRLLKMFAQSGQCALEVKDFQLCYYKPGPVKRSGYSFLVFSRPT